MCDINYAALMTLVVLASLFPLKTEIHNISLYVYSHGLLATHNQNCYMNMQLVTSKFNTYLEGNFSLIYD